MKIKYSLSKKLKSQKVLELRKNCGSEDETERMWQTAIEQSLCIASAFDSDKDNKLVGIGFVVGNNRHAQLVDLTVHPDYRKHGIGGKLFDMRVNFCRGNKILYVGNTFDPKEPWLKDFYEKHGFRKIDFAMWLEDSVNLVSKNDKQGKGEL